MINLESPETWKDLLELKKIPQGKERIARRYGYQDLFYQEYLHLSSPDDRISQLKNRIGDREYLLEANAFPYNLLLANLPYVVHCVLWLKSPMSPEDITNVLTELCAPNIFVWYKNTIEKQSVPEVEHVQIFVNCATLAQTSEFKKKL